MLKFHGYNIYLDIAKYAADDSLAIVAYCDDGSPFGNLTVKIEAEPANESCAFIDTNNLGDEVVDFILENNLGEPTGRMGLSGFCIYPECVFNLDEVKKYSTPDNNLE